MKKSFENGVSTAAMVVLISAAPAMAQDVEAARNDEIVVTARKRTESLQDVPLSVQALGQEEQIKGALKSLEDYALKLPAVSYSQFLPGFSIIAFRGVTTTTEVFAGTSSSALYLDEIPVQLEGQNPEVRLVDIERLESVAGPQPTTYGASSQSGTLKFVTVQPDLEEFGGFVDVSGSVLQDGDESYDVSGAVNIPLVKNKLALRVAGWRAVEGGFIDAVEGTSENLSAPLDLSDRGVGNFFANEVEREFLSGDEFAREDIGKFTTQGVRASLKWQINDKWSATAMVQWQEGESDGVSAFNPSVGDLQTIRFNEESTQDNWYATLFKIEGDLGFADFTSSTGYLNREFFYQFDASTYWSGFLSYLGGLENQYASYLTSVYGAPTAYLNPAYQATITGFDSYLLATNARDPSVISVIDTKSERISQEIRLASKPDSSIQWVAGGYYEKFTDAFEFAALNRNVGELTQYFNEAIYGTTANPEFGQFISAAEDTIEQWALFAEFGFDITDRLNILGGARYFDIDQTNEYLTIVNDGNIIFNCLRSDPADPNSACVTDDEGNPLRNLAEQPDDGFVTLMTLTYDINDDTLAYFTRSTGFRVGGANILRPDSSAPERYFSDTLVNYEIGLKSTFLDGRLVAALSAYHMVWKDLQINVEDVTAPGFNSIIVNSGRALIQGIEANWRYNVTDSILFDGAFAYIDARSTEEVAIENDDAVGGETLVLGDGEQLPLSPNWAFNFGLEKAFEFPKLGLEAYARFDYTYVGDQFNATTGSVLLTETPFSPGVPEIQPNYDIGRIALGFNKDDWTVNFFVNNLWNERPVLFNPPRFPDDRTYTARPREYTINIRRTF